MNNKNKQKKFAMAFTKGDKVLELGSGGGDFLELCAGCGLKATGVDTNSNARAGVKVIKKEILSYLKTSKNSTWNGIYARHVVEHFEPEKLTLLIKHVYRNLKKGGKFILIFPNMKNINVATYDFWNDITHKRPYTDDVIKKLLLSTGFKIEKAEPDKESWDSSIVKRFFRLCRSILTGLKNEAPDYYIVAVK